MITPSSIHDLMNQVRDFVNNPRKHYQLRQSTGLFSQLVSALDTIEDAEEAIKSFPTITIGSTGTLYLGIYGLLQAMFLQQDAAIHLCEALNIQESLANYPKLKEIREIRNDSIGHPTKRDRPKPTSYHQISRVSMSQQGFKLLSHYGDGSRQFRDISIPDMTAVQMQFISEMLVRIIGELKAEDKAHKEHFRMEKLIGLFPSTTTYAFEKASAVMYAVSAPVEIAQWGIEGRRENASLIS